MKWQEELTHNISTVDELGELLKLEPDELANMREVVKQFPMSIPRYYFSLIDRDDPNDPIRRMAVPTNTSLDPEGALDTSGENDNTVLPGMQHKYRQTVLILTTSRCAMYCRHCFRRRLVGLPGAEVAEGIADMADYIRRHPMVNNVLLSGGDALLNSNERLAAYLETFSELPQLNYIRLGSRVPVTFPQRITSDGELLALLERINKKKQLYVVTHFNHPRECTEEAAAAVRALQKIGIPVKNQTVLLHGVNDDPEVLARLMGKLTAMGVIPHYIFQCRPVYGIVSRFQLPLSEGSRIIREMMQKLDGPAKSADYVMSHPAGKIRILGENEDGEMCFQFKQAKDFTLTGKIFTRKLGHSQKWLDDNCC